MDLDDLLKTGESTWLDWKADFPADLKAGSSGANWDAGKARLLKDLVAIANASDGRSCGYLVYGVKDRGTYRQVLGTKWRLDDADVQTWANNAFSPTPTFRYEERSHSGVPVGVFEITRSPDYPHVCEVTLGGVLFEGQVWHRVGSMNAVAHHEQLAAMFKGDVPFVFRRTDDPELKKLQTTFEGAGYRVSYAAVARKESLLLQGRSVGHFPGTRREIVVGRDPKNPELVMMLEQRQGI